MPIDVEKPRDFFDTLSDGLVLIFLINKHFPGKIDMKKVKTKANLNPFETMQNLQFLFEGCKELIKVVGVSG